MKQGVPLKAERKHKREMAILFFCQRHEKEGRVDPFSARDGTPVITSYDKVVRIIYNDWPGRCRNILSVSSGIIMSKKRL